MEAANVFAKSVDGEVLVMIVATDGTSQTFKLANPQLTMKTLDEARYQRLLQLSHKALRTPNAEPRSVTR